MRRRLAHTLIAAILAMTMLSPSTARPAAAVSVGAVIAVVQQLYSIYKTYKAGTGLTLDQATAQILTAINNSQAAIISQIDQVAAAQVKACAQAAVIDFADIELFSSDTLQAFARDATNCVTLANSLLTTLSDPAAIDQLGFAVNEVGPLALIARTRAGLTTGALTTVLIDSNHDAQTALTPTCLTRLQGVGPGGPLPGNTYTAWAQCTVYNGDTGTRANVIRWPPTSNPFDVTGAFNDSVAKISWPATVAALASLQP